METKKKGLNKKRLIILLAVLVIVIVAVVFALNIQKLEPDAKVIENGLSVDEGDVAGVRTQVNDWLGELGYQ